jgi:type IV pilus assembly protein PilC
MIRISEDSGNMEGLLDNTADFYDEEVENSLQRFIALIEPIMILFLALNVGLIVLAMVTPMFDMLKTVQ